MIYSGNREPPLAELLDDPIAVLLRRCDKLSRTDIWAAIGAARRRLDRLDRPVQIDIQSWRVDTPSSK